LDKSMRYQQPVDKFNVRFILLLAISNEYPILQPLIPQVLAYLASGHIEKFKEINEVS